MMGRRNIHFAVGILVACLLRESSESIAAQKASTPLSKATCYECHQEVKKLGEGSKHAKLSCNICHRNTDQHLADSGVKPETRIEHAICGECHKDQYKSFFEVNYQVAARKEKAVPTGRSPLQDKLLAPHGFIKEHNEPRGHAFMLIDQFSVDRFAGGKFQFKNRMDFSTTGKVWDVLHDTGKELPETAKAGNPTCIQCKTTDHILKWKFMGDKDPAAKWDRMSDIIAIAKDTHNPMGCIHCHDPHAAKPRIVRDALIQAIAQQRMGDGDKKGDLTIVDFRGFRKIGIMGKTDSRKMCGQCHVEYNCNAGSSFSQEKKIGYNDQRTNHFPMKQPRDLLEHYKKLDFFDFKHEVTGARLVKLQHPEFESYRGSVHDRSGVQCHDCHMPKRKNNVGKSFTTHGVVRPIQHIEESCSVCHRKKTVERLKYAIETTQNYVKGKMRKAELWLARLIDTYDAAKKIGVGEAVLKQAREQHEEAHILWEWWTAENSDGWHNPDLARDSLVGSITASKKGIELLKKAMEAK
ncbi:MAG: ammonia-forming cytochrome c nitrite reductase subunit c552 [Deltaproteobacteria bacterium]|nr:ammonia-forming cytochrome c nitrite reductase subunit c552 [Deltaproteobacteria bacterium]